MNQAFVHFKKYPIEPIEITGQYAMFSNPCGGSQSSSYPFITPTAAKGIVEAINYMPQVIFKLSKIVICKPVKYETFGFNATVSHLRKYSQISGGSSLQRKFSVLCDPVYHIYGYFQNLPNEEVNRIVIKDKFRHINHAHACQEIFNRKLKKGQYTQPPCLGQKKFTANYCGPIRRNDDGEQIYNACQEVNIIVPTMPSMWFDKPQLGSKVQPSFIHNVQAINGIVIFDKNYEAEISYHKGALIHA